MIPTGQQTADQIIEREVRELVRRRGLDPGDGDAATVRHLIDEVVADYAERRLTASMPPLTDPGQVAKTVADRVVGMGPLQPYFDDPDIEEIWINEPGKVFVATGGRPQLTTTVLTEQQVRDLVEVMLRASGRRVDLSSPFVDATLADGSRLHVVIPDITRRHWAVNIRRFVLRAHSLAELVRLGTMTDQCARFLEASVVAGLNIVTAGATQAGKTTLLTVREAHGWSVAVRRRFRSGRWSLRRCLALHVVDDAFDDVLDLLGVTTCVCWATRIATMSVRAVSSTWRTA
jgi:pilus assembly protein CpaF